MTANHDMLVSVVIASCDEGPAVVATVRSAIDAATGPLEVIVVDDASSDGSCDALADLGRPGASVQVIRLARNSGAGAARSIGLAAAMGRCAALCDAHMGFPVGIWHAVAERAVAERAIYCPAVATMRDKAAQGCGGYLKWVFPEGRMGVKYDLAGPDTPDPHDVEAIIGACYFVPREVAGMLPSWTSIYGRYGYEEEALGAWAWLSGVPIRAWRAWTVLHEYAGTGNAARPSPPWGSPQTADLWLNACVAHATLFEPETWALLRPAAVTRLRPAQVDLLARIEAGRGREIGQWRAAKVRTDAAFFRDVLRVPIEEGPRGSVARFLPHTVRLRQTPRISIVMATHNRDEQLRFGLGSIRRQNREDIEVVVVNDGAPGQVAAICESAGARLIDLARERTPWRCPVWALNVGVREARGNILVLTCPEIYHLDDAIARLVAPLDTGDWAALCVPDRKTGGFRDDSGAAFRLLESGETDPAKIVAAATPGLQTQVPFLMAMERQHYLDIGGADEDFSGHSADDDDLVNRLTLSGAHYADTSARCIHLWHAVAHGGHDEAYRANVRLFWKRTGCVPRNHGREWGNLT